MISQILGSLLTKTLCHYFPFSSKITIESYSCDVNRCMKDSMIVHLKQV